jgi:hypothetical protein
VYSASPDLFETYFPVAKIMMLSFSLPSANNGPPGIPTPSQGPPSVKYKGVVLYSRRITDRCTRLKEYCETNSEIKSLNLTPEFTYLELRCASPGVRTNVKQ